MSTPIRILGIAGSLRRESYNRAALRAATKLVPEDAILETCEIDGTPPFNQNEEQNPPSKVIELKRRIREADAILFVTPEYNYSVPGVLKNAIDWATRPVRRQCMERQTSGHYGRVAERHRHGACARSSAADSRVPEYVSNQSA